MSACDPKRSSPENDIERMQAWAGQSAGLWGPKILLMPIPTGGVGGLHGKAFRPRRTPLCRATVRIMAALRTVLGCKINDLACAHHDGADFTYRRLLAMRQCWVSGGSRPSAAARLLASSISSSSVLSSNAPGSPTSRRSMMRPSILALPIDACTAAEG